MIQRVGITLAAVVLLVGHGMAADDSEVRVTEVPKVVLNSFGSAYPSAKVYGYSRDTWEGETVYEINTRKGRLETGYFYNSDGTLVQVEEEIALKYLPEAVSKSIAQAYPTGQIDEAEKVTRGTTIEYEVDVRDGDQTVEVRLSADGKVLSSAVDDEGDEADAEDPDEGPDDD